VAALVALPAVAGASTTVGSPLTAAPSSGTCGAGTFTNTALSSGTLLAPFDGVIVRWRLNLSAAGGSFAYKLRVLHPAGGTTYTGVSTGPAQTAPLAGLNVLTLPTPIQIHTGDLVGVDCPAGAPVAASTSAPLSSKYAFFNSPPLADGSTRSPNNQIAGDEELVNADVVGVPVVSAVAPATGSTAGGSTVTISGSRLADVTTVTFGGVAASGVTVVSDGQVTAIAPPHVAGPVDVQATDAAGASPVVAGDSYTYLVPPAPPVLSHLAQSHRSWRKGKKAVRHVARGTTFSFRLDQPASVSLAFAQKVSGRKAGKLTVSGGAGTNRVRFRGRLSRSRSLKPGRYTVTATAANAAGLHSSAKTLSFTIVG
jgi:hypothetical protein